MNAQQLEDTIDAVALIHREVQEVQYTYGINDADLVSAYDTLTTLREELITLALNTDTHTEHDKRYNKHFSRSNN